MIRRFFLEPVITNILVKFGDKNDYSYKLQIVH